MHEEVLLADLPPCGLYRTATALPDRAEQVPAGKLVYFHDHSNEPGVGIVLMPEENTGNRWKFMERGFLVRQASWARSLVPMKPEGFYTVAGAFQKGTTTVAQGQLVQLGYNRDAQPIVFFPNFDAERNGLVFPTKGMSIGPDVYDGLRPVELRGPKRATVQ